ncbi:MAG: ABC transporter permease [Chryseolinea sp.]
MNKIQPPNYALRFLHWFCPPGLYEGIEGDLLEQFEEDVNEVGEKKARTRFAFHTINFFRPSIVLRNRFSVKLISTIMIGNYLKVASRNIQKRKFYSFINAFGLSIGIAFCVLIYLYIQDERSFDQFHANKDRIFRMDGVTFDTWQSKSDDPYQRSAWLQMGLKQALTDEIPEVEFATRFTGNEKGIFKFEDKIFTERVSYVDGDFFKMFSFKLLKGNAEKLFQNKTDVVLTPAIAEKYFGDEDPIGKSVSINNDVEQMYTVAGIIEAPPANSSFAFQILLPQENRPYYKQQIDKWGNFNTPAFAQLRPNSDLTKFKTSLDKLVEKYTGELNKDWRKESINPIPKDAKFFEIQFTRLTDMHLKNEISWDKVSDPQYSMILGGVAVLILIIACINYISLALTTSASRRTEVGIRKVVGALKNQLVYQFSFESVIIALASMIIGLFLVILFLQPFNLFTDKGIQLTWGNSLPVIGVSLAITIVVGLLAGSYPALFLSKFKPALVLKGGFTSKLQSGFTKPLVILQFALSAFLIISSVIMYKQMRFVATKDLGYNQHQVLVVPTQKAWNEESNKTVEQFRERLSQEKDVISVGGTSISFNQGWSRNGYKINDEQKSAYVYAVDPFYIPTLNVQMALGRNFDTSILSDSNAVIVNEALVKDMKWADPLNSYLNWTGDTVGLGYRVVGVVKDYHFLSLEATIEPMLLSINKESAGYLTNMQIKISPDNIPATIERIQKAWKELYPDRPFDYAFLDQDVARQYESYERWMSIMGLATGFAILISCLGLFGLAGINAVNRTKEIGIRKVMGADLRTIFVLLNKQFIWLAIVAFCIASPLSWWFITDWYLKDFKFKVPVGWELFAISMGSGLLLAMATVSYHAIKAAMINPAETLKYE